MNEVEIEDYARARPPPDVPEDIEGLEEGNGSWGDYPIDEVLIRNETRTIHDVMRRVDQGGYVMDPDFQRDFIWDEKKQSKLIDFARFPCCRWRTIAEIWMSFSPKRFAQ